MKTWNGSQINEGGTIMRKISTRTRKSIIRSYLKAVAAKSRDDDARSGVPKTGLRAARRARAASRMTVSRAAVGRMP
jgi:hypothetical protein